MANPNSQISCTDAEDQWGDGCCSQIILMSSHKEFIEEWYEVKTGIQDYLKESKYVNQRNDSLSFLSIFWNAFLHFSSRKCINGQGNIWSKDYKSLFLPHCSINLNETAMKKYTYYKSGWCKGCMEIYMIFSGYKEEEVEVRVGDQPGKTSGMKWCLRLSVMEWKYMKRFPCIHRRSAPFSRTQERKR